MEKHTYKIDIKDRYICLITLVVLALMPKTANAVDVGVPLLKISTEYTYHAPPEMSESEARKKALDRAKLLAIEEHFGTLITQNNSTFVNSRNNQTDVNFISFSESEVKGRWIETIGEPKYEVYYQDGLIVRVKVDGLIQEITSSDIDISIRVLCNGVSEKFERTDFHNGDDLFIRFESPVDGYLAVYLADTQGNVFCLLPYPDDEGRASVIKGGIPRILFSYDYNELNEAVRQYHMTTDCANEVNQLYVVFSRNRFDKANDSATDRLLPRQLSYEQFHKWLSRCRKFDNSIIIREIPITIYG